MFKLEILKSDGSLYWKEHFNKQSEAKKWIAEEQTRPYYDESFTYTIVRIGKTDAEIEAEKAAKELADIEDDKQRKKALKKIKTVCGLTNVELKALFGMLGDE